MEIYKHTEDKHIEENLIWKRIVLLTWSKWFKILQQIDLLETSPQIWSVSKNPRINLGWM